MVVGASTAQTESTEVLCVRKLALPPIRVPSPGTPIPGAEADLAKLSVTMVSRSRQVPPIPLRKRDRPGNGEASSRSHVHSGSDPRHGLARRPAAHNAHAMPSSKALNHQYGVSPLHARSVPIGEYGFLSDGEVSALLAPGGSVDWMCVPRFDSPSVFGSLLGRHAGTFRISPTDVDVPVDTRYVPGTMIIETSWGTPTGWLVVRDALLMGPWHHDDNTRSRNHRRTPNDYAAEHILLRTVRCVSGEVQMVMDCEPVLDYGRKHVRWDYTDHGYRQAVAQSEGSDVELTLTSDLRLGFEGGQASARTLLKQGDTRYIALSWGGAPAPLTFEDAYKKQVWTAHHWQHWLARGKFPDHPWRAYLQRSALTLKGLTYAPTGAIAAAGTTSLPETPGGERNYDYRYTWIRDATFALWGLYSLGFRLGGAGLLRLHRRRRRTRRRHPDHVRDRWRGRAGGVRTRSPARLRRFPAGTDRQRGLPPAAARRVGGLARLGLPARQGRRSSRQPGLADLGEAGHPSPQALARTRRRHLGGARRAEALHLLQDHVLGGGRPRRQAGPGDGGGRQGQRVGAGGAGDQGRHLGQRGRQAWRLHAVLRH